MLFPGSKRPLQPSNAGDIDERFSMQCIKEKFRTDADTRNAMIKPRNEASSASWAMELCSLVESPNASRGFGNSACRQ